mmetsp:Transcript_6434/g.17191  ORF Transcript_6434/g.17191 Transcript_6434/m.17191 type:complete len:104 (+) Transcript_6434:1024-1335(+)
MPASEAKYRSLTSRHRQKHVPAQAQGFTDRLQWDARLPAQHSTHSTTFGKLNKTANMHILKLSYPPPCRVMAVFQATVVKNNTGTMCHKQHMFMCSNCEPCAA